MRESLREMDDGPEVEGEDDILLDPRSVIDVLEPWFNRQKLDGQSSMPSVEHRTRQPDGSWVLRSYRGDDAVPLLSLPRPLSLHAIHQNVDV